MISYKSWSLVVGIIVLLLIGGIVLSTTSFVDREPTHAATINSGTTYYVNGSNYYTRSSVAHYECTNSQHSDENDYISPLPEDGVCYVVYTKCVYCNGTGETRLGSQCSKCQGRGYTSAYPYYHEFSFSHYTYIYYNIDTGGTIET